MFKKFLIFPTMFVVVSLATNGLSNFIIAAFATGSVLIYDLGIKSKSKSDWERVAMAFTLCTSSVFGQLYLV